MHKKLPRKFPSFIWYFLKPYKWLVALVILLTILAGFCVPMNSLLIKQIVDLLPKGDKKQTTSLIIPTCLLVLNFTACNSLLWRLIEYINCRLQGRLKNNIIRTMMETTLGHPASFFHHRLSGRTANQITMLANSIETIVHKTLPIFTRSATVAIISLSTVYYTHSIFLYIFLAWFILFLSVSIWASKRLVLLSHRYAHSASTLTGQLVDCVTNHHTIRLFAKEKYEIDRMESFFGRLQKTFEKKALFSIFTSALQGAMIAMLIGCCSYFLIDLYGKSLVTIGDFTLILNLSLSLGYTMWYTMERVKDFYQAMGRGMENLSLLVVDNDVKESQHARNLEVKEGRIVFQKVHFHYKGKPPLFENLSLTIKAREKVGLVGYSGSGKTSFVSLLLRLYEVNKGHISIDGQPIAQITKSSLREAIALIPQEPSLFHRSLMENIRYSQLHATEEEVKEAARRAHAHSFIEALPEGYASFVGERGLGLSGGQRQRVAIARAFLKNAPILVLDEATSQLDGMTEKLIQKSLTDLMQDKTSIVIAHRLSTLLQMDRILVFHKGKIVEEGHHEHLLNKEGLYKKLWDAQVGGFLTDEEESA